MWLSGPEKFKDGGDSRRQDDLLACERERGLAGLNAFTRTTSTAICTGGWGREPHEGVSMVSVSACPDLLV